MKWQFPEFDSKMALNGCKNVIFDSMAFMAIQKPKGKLWLALGNPVPSFMEHRCFGWDFESGFWVFFHRWFYAVLGACSVEMTQRREFNLAENLFGPLSGSPANISEEVRNRADKYTLTGVKINVEPMKEPNNNNGGGKKVEKNYGSFDGEGATDIFCCCCRSLRAKGTTSPRPPRARSTLPVGKDAS